MSDEFISYSRKDAAFVQRLNKAFVDAQRVVWIDWQDIAHGELDATLTQTPTPTVTASATAVK